MEDPNQEKLAFIGRELIRLDQKMEELCKENLSSLSQRLLSSSATSKSPLTISKVQAEILQTLVQKKKKGNRKEIMALWRAFHQKFDVNRYKLLPKNQFKEAYLWIEEDHFSVGAKNFSPKPRKGSL